MLGNNRKPPALAQDAPSLAVRYNDLDLASEPGQATLATRVQVAIREVCRPATKWDRSALHRSNQCRQQLAEQTLPEIRRAIARSQARSTDRLAGR